MKTKKAFALILLLMLVCSCAASRYIDMGGTAKINGKFVGLGMSLDHVSELLGEPTATETDDRAYEMALKGVSRMNPLPPIIRFFYPPYWVHFTEGKVTAIIKENPQL